jgi:hypothetical protein
VTAVFFDRREPLEKERVKDIDQTSTGQEFPSCGKTGFPERVSRTILLNGRLLSSLFSIS